ncbi:SDR family oxidoreductase [Vibrio viridaestus]|uniref:SDR family oxidoreductase n=1 Tax=Vibrio viridaestus TaxID=2487322 RepID=A0A3N9THR7_9VIBR|nr:SDR family oxidoreductase [Vibrio viridaestus]
MSKVFVIGATGGVGHRLCPELIHNGHKVKAMYRSDEQKETLKAIGCETVKADLMEMTAEQLTDMTKGCDIIVFSAGAAGSGLPRTSEIDGQGPVKMVEAAERNGIRRIYLVSAFPEAGRGNDPKPGFEHYMKVKKQADTYVTASDLDWVILRPGTLLHEDADGKIALGWSLNYGSVKRGNVANTLAKLIDSPQIKKQILELTDGKSTIADAVSPFLKDS